MFVANPKFDRAGSQLNATWSRSSSWSSASPPLSYLGMGEDDLWYHIFGDNHLVLLLRQAKTDWFPGQTPHRIFDRSGETNITQHLLRKMPLRSAILLEFHSHPRCFPVSLAQANKAITHMISYEKKVLGKCSYKRDPPSRSIFKGGAIISSLSLWPSWIPGDFIPHDEKWKLKIHSPYLFRGGRGSS